MTPEELERHLAFITHETLAAVRAFFDGRRSFAAVERMLADTYDYEGKTKGALVAALARDPKVLPVCAPGCAYCCYLSVFASPPEILFIAAHLRQTRSPDALAAITARVVEASGAVLPMTRQDRAHAKRACPLLDVATGRCGAYDVRPLTCRAYNSCDAGVCKSAFDEDKVRWDLPVDLFQLTASRNVRTGFLAGLEAAGLDPGPYELACGLAVALTTKDAAERWLDGERLFSAAETPIGRSLRDEWSASVARAIEEAARR